MTTRWFTLPNLWSGLLILAAIPGFMTASDGDVDEAQQLGIYLAQHGYGAMPVDRTSQNKQIVEAQINGKVVELSIDTGCNRTLLTTDCARRLGLEVHDTGRQDWGLGGEIKGKTGIAVVSSFTLKKYEINHINTVEVLPPSAYVGEDVDGYFGFDCLALNAVILPVGARRILFKPGTAPPPPIDHYMEVLGFKPIPLHYSKGGLRIEGHLNGQSFIAMVDCGSVYSTFDLAFVRKIGAGIISYSGMELDGLDGHDTATNGFMPKEMDLGPLSLPPMEMAVASPPMFGREGIDALLGYDVLASHHAIIDLGHGTLWMK